MSGYGLWNFFATLSCGHVVEFGTLTTEQANQAAPRRKDHSFAALKCPNGCGRRRVRQTCSSHLYRHGTQLIAALTGEAAQADGERGAS